MIGKRRTGVLGEQPSGKAAPSGSHGQDVILLEIGGGPCGRDLTASLGLKDPLHW
jgi:hypothetical protein